LFDISNKPTQMKMYLEMQRYYQRGGNRLGKDVLIGVVIAPDEESAIRAIPEDAPSTWEGMIPVIVQDCGEVPVHVDAHCLVKVSL
jgi:hypothetical protein